MNYADTELGTDLWRTKYHVRRTVTGIKSA